VKLNLGCGPQVPEGWINVDYALGARFAKSHVFRAVNRRVKLFNLEWNDAILIHDLTTRFPWPDASADVVYSSHTLEHLSRDEGRHFLGESHRVLKPGGTIRIVVPDLAVIIRRYLGQEIRADAFVEALGVLYERQASPLKTRLAPFIQFPHKCMYDTATLEAVLRELGFDATARPPFDSAIPDIRAVELVDRTHEAVIVEGRKA